MHVLPFMDVVNQDYPCCAAQEPYALRRCPLTVSNVLLTFKRVCAVAETNMCLPVVEALGCCVDTSFVNFHERVGFIEHEWQCNKIALDTF
jgi:hypothetical protein